MSEYWRAFVDEYTPLLVRLIRRSGLRDQDEVMDVYTRVCERLSANDCARLRHRQAGSMDGWLAVVVRHAVVDWVRSRAGRPRLFEAVRALDRFDHRVFEHYYWEQRRPVEIAGLLEPELRRAVDLGEVFDSLARINRVLTERHRAELLSMVARSGTYEALDDPDHDLDAMPSLRDDRTPEALAAAREESARVNAALDVLPAEQAAIVRLHFLEGLTLPEVRRALRLETLSDSHVSAIVATIRQRVGTPPGGDAVGSSR